MAFYTAGEVFTCVVATRPGVHGRGLRVTHCQGTRKQCQIKAHSGEPGGDCCGSNSSELFEVGGHGAAGSQLPFGAGSGHWGPSGCPQSPQMDRPSARELPEAQLSCLEVCAAGITQPPLALCCCWVQLCTVHRAGPEFAACWYQNLLKKMLFTRCPCASWIRAERTELVCLC